MVVILVVKENPPQMERENLEPTWNQLGTQLDSFFMMAL